MDPAMTFSGDIDVVELFQPGADRVAIVDPTLKQCGLLWVPREQVGPSKALKRITGQEQMPPSLCLLYQKGQCRADQRCNQLHVNPMFIRALRKAMAGVPYTNCCLGHGDLPSHRREFQVLLSAVPVVLARNGVEDVTLPPTAVALTLFWRPFMDQQARAQNGVLRFSAARVCRLHQRGECKFGVDCNNIHVCREFWEGRRPPSACSPTPSISVSVSSSSLTDAYCPYLPSSDRRLSALSCRSSLSISSVADDTPAHPLLPAAGPRPATPQTPPPSLQGQCASRTPTPLQQRLPAATPNLCYLCIPVFAPCTPTSPMASIGIGLEVPLVSPPRSPYTPMLASDVTVPSQCLTTLQPLMRPSAPSSPRPPIQPASSMLDAFVPRFSPPRPQSIPSLGNLHQARQSLKLRRSSGLRRPSSPQVAAPCPDPTMAPMQPSAVLHAQDDVAEQCTMMNALPAALLADL